VIDINDKQEQISQCQHFFSVFFKSLLANSLHGLYRIQSKRKMMSEEEKINYTLITELNLNRVSFDFDWCLAGNKPTTSCFTRHEIGHNLMPHSSAQQRNRAHQIYRYNIHPETDIL